MNSNGTNKYVWSFGNGVTCTALGTVAQFGITLHLYSAALSMYFLSTIRFGVPEERFSKYYERWIHGLILLFGLVTASVGCAQGLYENNHVGPGCWISQPPESDSYDTALKMVWISAGIPTLLVVLCIAWSSCLLYLHIRATVSKNRQRALGEHASEVAQNNSAQALSNMNKNSVSSEDASEVSQNNSAQRPLRTINKRSVCSEVASAASQNSSAQRPLGNMNKKSVCSEDASNVSQNSSAQRPLGNMNKESVCSEDASKVSQNSSAQRPLGNMNKESVCSEDASKVSQNNSANIQSDKHWKRVQDVGRQPFLYVGAYVLCFGWTIVLQTLEDQGFEKKTGSGAFLLPLVILQSIFLPAQGLFNAIIFFRPNYNQTRTEFPEETKLWCMKRTVWGAVINSTTNRLNRNIVDLSFPQKREMSDAEEKLRISNVAVKSTAACKPCLDVGEFIQAAHTLRDKMSSLTESENDFDKLQIESQADDRWGDCSIPGRSHDVPPTHRSMSFKKTALNLEEHSASLGGNHTMAAASIGSTDTPTDAQIRRKLSEDSDCAESRWCAKVSPNRRNKQDATTDSLGIPERYSTNSEPSDSKCSSSSVVSSKMMTSEER
eukprot:scaffold991_cov128-Cylindrotheca_fusiformis.AAC.28